METRTTRILLAEDDEIMRVTLYDRLKSCGWSVEEVEDGKAACAMLQKNKYHIVISDIKMPNMTGLQLLDYIRKNSPNTDVIFMTAYGSVEDAVSCLKKGAADYLLKPFDMDDLIIRIKRLIETQTIKARCSTFEECCERLHRPIIGTSKAINDLMTLISQVAQSDSTVLIHGESGTGKELVAAAIHFNSRRAQEPYVKINCAAIPEGLMESEMFGHVKGAFTGAEAQKIGRFEQADGGTLLLDEIGDMPLNLQAKLLRVLEEKVIERVGSTRSIKVDVRILCSTAKDLAREAEKGNFRDDLFYRLQVIPVHVPPLRERKEDIPELANYFLNEFTKGRHPRPRFSEDTLLSLQKYGYPGNVRELKNIIERVSVLTLSPVIEPWNLPADIASPEIIDETEMPTKLAAALAKTERTCIMHALKLTSGNKTEAAKLLGISRKNLWEKLKLHGVQQIA